MNKKVMMTLLIAGFALVAAAEEGDGNVTPTAKPQAKYSFFSVAVSTTDDAYKEAETDRPADRTTAYFERKLKDCTSTREEMVPGESMQRTVTHKVDIYNAVRNIHKGLEKTIAADPQQQTSASATMQRVARVAVAAFYNEGSTAFENALHDARKDYKKQIDIFNSVALDE